MKGLLATHKGLYWSLRTFYTYYDTDAGLENLIDFCRKVGIDGVMLINTYGHYEQNHLSDAIIEERSLRMEVAARTLRRAGLGVGVNVHATIGMNLSPPDITEFGFQHQVDSNGWVNIKTGCPLCPTFRSYLDRLLYAMAVPDAEYLFLDDDYTYKIEGMGCWCPLHMKAFSDAIGRTISREEWYTEASAPSYRLNVEGRAWAHVQTDALLKGWRSCAEAAHRRNPEIILGNMGINSDLNLYGLKYLQKMHRIFRTRQAPLSLVRPNTGQYQDEVRNGIREHPVLQIRSVVDGATRRVTEIDCGAPWSESITGTEHLRYRMERFVALGERIHSLLLFPDGQGHRLDVAHPYARMLKQSRRMMEAMSELVDDDMVAEGVDCTEVEGYLNVVPVTPHYLQCSAPYVGPAQTLARLGMAMAPDRSRVPVLYDHQPWLMGKQEVRRVLSHGGLIDATAVSSMARMGMTNVIGDAQADGKWDRRPVGVRFTDHPLNGGAAGKTWASIGTVYERAQKLEGTFREEDVLSWWLDERFNRTSPAEVAVESHGRRTALLSYDLVYPVNELLWAQGFIVNHVRQSIYQRLCTWIAGGPLPAMVTDAIDVVLFCLVSPRRDRTALVLINNGHNRYEHLTVEAAALPRRWKTVRTVDRRERIVSEELDVEPLKGSVRLRLPASLAPHPFEVRILAFE